MGKNRLEAFSDGVIAIIITIMVLEMKAPHDASLAALAELYPVFLSYVLSFVYVVIYWHNHHHMLCTLSKVRGDVMWANSVLLFFLSLLPFTTAWMGENHFAQWPMAVYGFNLLAAALAFFVLQNRIVAVEGPGSTLARAIGTDWKGRASPFGYLAGILLAFLHPLLGFAAFVAVALVWIVPDRRIETVLGAGD
jgi:uncharacterized membrane protein